MMPKKSEQTTWMNLVARFPNLPARLETDIRLAAARQLRKPLDVWTTITISPDRKGFVVFAHVAICAGEEYHAYPVIPDEHNPHPEKLVMSEDKPHVFAEIRQANNAATRAKKELEEQMKATFSEFVDFDGGNS